MYGRGVKCDRCGERTTGKTFTDDRTFCEPCYRELYTDGK